jgi:hypothetical protein
MHIFHKRQGQMDLGIPYFYTVSIQNVWVSLEFRKLKMIIKTIGWCLNNR